MHPILIVDDEHADIEGLRDGISWRELSIAPLHTATNIRAARERFRHSRIDILLCKIDMPQESSIRLLEWVKAHHPDTLAILFSAHGEFEEAQRAAFAGAFDCLPRPTTAFEFENVLQRAIRNLDERARRQIAHEYVLSCIQRIISIELAQDGFEAAVDAAGVPEAQVESDLFLDGFEDILLRCQRPLYPTGCVRQAIQTINQYVGAHLDKDFNRDTLARLVHLSPSYLSRMYRQETGISISDYITGIRLQEIKRLLRRTDLSVSDIADQTGYANLAYLSKVFKQHTGMTPLEYRKKCKLARR